LTQQCPYYNLCRLQQWKVGKSACESRRGALERKHDPWFTAFYRLAVWLRDRNGRSDVGTFLRLAWNVSRYQAELISCEVISITCSECVFVCVCDCSLSYPACNAL
jgi:hypothetical protein